VTWRAQLEQVIPLTFNSVTEKDYRCGRTLSNDELAEGVGFVREFTIFKSIISKFSSNSIKIADYTKTTFDNFY